MFVAHWRFKLKRVRKRLLSFNCTLGGPVEGSYAQLKVDKT